MNKANSHATTYFCIGGTLFGLSFLASGWNRVSLITLAIVFALSSLLFIVSVRFKARRLLRITEHMGNITLSHLVIFLMLCGLGITLLKNNIVLPGLISICAAYFILARGIGLVLGREVLRPIFTNRDS